MTTPYQPDASKPNYQPNKQTVPGPTPANPNDPQAPKGRDENGNPIK
jgi:hypothetical protein